MALKLAELPYCEDSAKLFSHIADCHWSVFLDSGYPSIALGRYDIVAAQPYITLKTFAEETEISYADGRREYSRDDPFALVKSVLGEQAVPQPSTLPFVGGALGYFGYDLARRLETLPELSEHDLAMPDMAIGIYDWVVIVDHEQRRAWLASYGQYERTLDEWDDLRTVFASEASCHSDNVSVHSALHTDLDKAAYARAFHEIKRYIRAGDCYQVNLTQRFSVKFVGDPWAFYRALRRVNPAPYGGFFNIAEGAILSTSPERFLKVNHRLVETKPIKGTRQRSLDRDEDRALREDLLASEKDRAENVMIVDLLRNDLGKSCRYGSVSVPKLFALEGFARVHHLVSTVVGQLSDDRHALDLLRGCFPGGSITGAPKVRAMEIIETLEPYRRGVYCGTLAYVGFDGNMDSNIIIRTVVHYQDRLYCWAGGGIVADSRLDLEYQECFDKVLALFELLKPPGV